MTKLIWIGCLLFSSVCWGQTSVPDAPSTVKPTCTENSGKPCPEWVTKLVGQYPPVKQPWPPVKSWSEAATGKGSNLFWTEHGIALAASVFDAEVTHQAQANCPYVDEANPELPKHPSRGQLYRNFLEFDGGFTFADFLLRKWNIRYATHVWPAYATFIHIKGAYSWHRIGCI